MKSEDINFIAFKSSTLTDAEWVRASKAKGELYNFVKLILILFAIVIGFFIVVAISVTAFTLNPMITMLATIALFVYMFYRASKNGNKNLLRLQKFAESNGWVYRTEVPSNHILENLGYSFSVSYIEGIVDGAKFWIHEVQAPTVNNQHLPSFDSLTTKLPKPVPTILIMPGVSALQPFADSIGSTFGLSPLRLEGDFDQHALAYCVPGQEIEALSYLTPDVMDVLANNITGVVLYADRYLYISPSEEMNTQEIFEYMFKDRRILLEEILQKQHLAQIDTNPDAS